MKAVKLFCRHCHVAGAEEQEEIRVISLRRDTNGILKARLQCECGHQWQTDADERVFRNLPGYKQAAQHIESASLDAPRVYGRKV